MSIQESLFKEWEKLSYRIKHLGLIIQNPNPLTDEDVECWKEEVKGVEGFLGSLVKQTEICAKGLTCSS